MQNQTVTSHCGDWALFGSSKVVQATIYWKLNIYNYIYIRETKNVNKEEENFAQ